MEQIPFLANLGIGSMEQARSPTVDTFPRMFNTNNRSDWEQAVQELIPSGNALQDWGITIRKYVNLCEQRNVFPFQSFQQNRNDQIYDYLRSRRKTFVNFIDKCNFFENVAIRSTHHKVVVSDRGFVLTVYARARIADPTFLDWLVKSPQPRFNAAQDMGGRYIRPLQDGLNMFVHPDGQDTYRWCIGYDIDCPFYPELPNNFIPSKAELERFILEVLWKPILRTSRPLNMSYRLI